jgi:hypothetical protein
MFISEQPKIGIPQLWFYRPLFIFPRELPGFSASASYCLQELLKTPFRSFPTIVGKACLSTVPHSEIHTAK